MEVSNDHFLINSPLTPAELKAPENLYQKEKSKNFSIKQKDLIIIKLHSSVLEVEYDATFNEFESEKLDLPEDIDAKLVEPVVKYLYFKELKEVSDNDIFPLLKIAVVLKINPLIDTINEFLLKPITSLERALVFMKDSFDFFLYNKEPEKNFISKTIVNCGLFLLKNKEYEKFLTVFNKELLEKMGDNVEFFFNCLKERVLIKSIVPNKYLIKFISIFKDSLSCLQKKIDPNFKKETFFKNILSQHLDLTKIDPKDFDLMETDDKNEAQNMLIQIMSENIEAKQSKIIILDNKIQVLTEKNERLEKKIIEVSENLEEFKTNFENKIQNKANSNEMIIEINKLKRQFEEFRGETEIHIKKKIKKEKKERNQFENNFFLKLKFDSIGYTFVS